MFGVEGGAADGGAGATVAATYDDDTAGGYVGTKVTVAIWPGETLDTDVVLQDKTPGAGEVPT